MVSCAGPTPASPKKGALVDYTRWAEDRDRLVQCATSKDQLIGFTLEKQNVIEQFIAGAK